MKYQPDNHRCERDLNIYKRTLCTTDANNFENINDENVSLEQNQGTSLLAQWLRIRLPMQGTRVQALVREDPTCRGATKPVHHNY